MNTASGQSSSGVALQELLQIHAVDVLEHDEPLRARLLQIEHRHDVAVHQRRRDARLVEQRAA